MRVLYTCWALGHQRALHTLAKSKTHPHRRPRLQKMYRRCIDYVFDDEDNRFPPIRSFFLFGGLVIYLTNAGLNAWVAYEYLAAKEAGRDSAAAYYLTATLVFIVLPVVAINVLSWGLYTWCYLVYKNAAVRNYCVHKCGKPRNVSSLIALGDLGGLSSAPDPPGTDPPGTCTSRAETAFSEPNPLKSGDNVELITSSDVACSGQSDETDVHVEFYALDVLTTPTYLLVTAAHLLMLGYEFRIFWLFYKRKDDRYSFERYRDLSFLRLMTAFMQSAPQLVLQLYISIITAEVTQVYRIVTPMSIIISMVSLALAVADYVSASKDVNYYDPPPDHPKTDRMTWASYVVFILWHLAMISGRGVVFALFASVYGAGLLIFLAVHYVGMVYWMYRQHAHVFTVRTHYISKSTLCTTVLDPRQHILRNYGVEFIVAVFNTFFHFKLQEVSSVESIVTFYSIAFVENTLLALLWYFGKDYSVAVWYNDPALLWVFASFAIGLVFMVAYYRMNRQKVEVTIGRPPVLTSSLNWLYRYNPPS